MRASDIFIDYIILIYTSTDDELCKCLIQVHERCRRYNKAFSPKKVELWLLRVEYTLVIWSTDSARHSHGRKLARWSTAQSPISLSSGFPRALELLPWARSLPFFNCSGKQKSSYGLRLQETVHIMDWCYAVTTAFQDGADYDTKKRCICMDRYSYDCRIPGADYDGTKWCIWTNEVTTAFQELNISGIQNCFWKNEFIFYEMWMSCVEQEIIYILFILCRISEARMERMD